MKPHHPWQIPMSMSQVCHTYNLTARAVRFYEQRRLIAPDRDSNGRRRYESASLERLAFIATARRAGLSLVQIGQLLRLGERDGTEARLAGLAELCRERLTAMEAERAELIDILGGLDAVEDEPVRAPAPLRRAAGGRDHGMGQPQMARQAPG
jgi:DNA-binding transcriptional MerR regulator